MCVLSSLGIFSISIVCVYFPLASFLWVSHLPVPPASFSIVSVYIFLYLLFCISFLISQHLQHHFLLSLCIYFPVSSPFLYLCLFPNLSESRACRGEREAASSSSQFLVILRTAASSAAQKLFIFIISGERNHHPHSCFPSPP